MATQTLASIRPQIEETLQRYGMPGAAIAIARDQHPIEVLAVGTDARGVAIASDSLFPVASITKLATALSVLRLADAGALHYEDRLDVFLPESAAAQAGVTLRMLLTHTSGLQGWEEELAPWTPTLTWSAITEAATQIGPDVAPGSRVSYSDVEFVLLAMVVERLTSQAFPAACHHLVLDPLAIEGYLGEGPPRPPVWIGDEPGPHTGTALERHNSEFFRSLGLSASGLVTTAAGALALVRAFAGVPSDFLRVETRKAATRDQTGGASGGWGPINEPAEFASFPWGLGPDLREHRDPAVAPSLASDGSFGHVGSSGCAVWADPSAGVAWSILGTRHLAAWWDKPFFSDLGGAFLELARRP